MTSKEQLKLNHPCKETCSGYEAGYEKGHSAGLSEGAELAKAIELPYDIDCGDHSCRFAKRKEGMRTNGGCRCAQFFDTPARVKELLHYIYIQQQALAKFNANRGKGV